MTRRAGAVKNALWIAVLMLSCIPAVRCAATDRVDQLDQPSKPLRALLLSGASNHDWRSTTPMIARILEGTRRFRVDVLEATHSLSAELLSDYDLIVSDFNTFTARYKEPRDPGWSSAARQALLQFVQGGKGHVAIHAGSSSFYDWPEYGELVISRFEVGRTDHGTRHEFPVRIDDPGHAVTQGMKAFTTFDELWHDVPVQNEATVLASAFSSKESNGSGRYEPIAMVRDFGAGRSFTLLLGHDTRAMENSAFQALLARGAEWAATGSVSIALPEEWPGVPAKELPLPERSFRWLQGDGSISLLDSDDVVWQFNYGDKAAKPYFHPLAMPGKPSLTWSSPPDHPWHHGLWFCWKYINGVNYWEEDPKTGLSNGLTEQGSVLVTRGEDFSTAMKLYIVYRPNKGEPVLTEKRVIAVSAPTAAGEYRIDWTMTFTAGEVDVLLDRTPLPHEPEGKVFGGYAGLSARLAADLERRVVVRSDGPVDFKDDRHRSRSRGMDYSGMMNGEAMGIAMVDHANNLNAPSPWYAIKSGAMSFFSPAVICYEPYRLLAGKSMTLRYRVIVHGGRLSNNALVSEYAAFNEESRF